MSEPMDPTPTAARSGRPGVPPALIGAGAALLVLVVAGIAFAASQVAAPHSDLGAMFPDGLDRGVPYGGRAPDRPRAVDPFQRFRPSDRDVSVRGPFAGLSEITITAISGADITVTSADGWTRTFSVTDATTISRAGQTIALTDLHVGDEIAFRQQRNDDGSYTVTTVEVVLPHVTGRVTATTADTMTIERADGTTMTLHVSAATTYRVRGVENATLADVSVGMVIVAEGPQDADGSLEALAVYAAKP